MPILYKSKEIRQRGSEGFTDEEEIADVGLVDLIWNVYKRGAMESLLSHSPPEERADKAVDLLAGDSKPRHRPFSRQVTVDLYGGERHLLPVSFSGGSRCLLIVVQNLHGSLFGFQLEISGGCASALCLLLITDNINFCHGFWALLR